VLRRLDRHLTTQQPFDNVQAHVDASGDACRTDYSTIIHDTADSMYVRPGCDLAQKIQRAMVRGRFQAVQQPRFAQEQSPCAHGKKEFGFRGCLLDPVEQRLIIYFVSRSLTTRNQKQVGLWAVGQAMVGIDTEPTTAENRPLCLRHRENVTSARTLTETLTKHLQEVSHDKHLRVVYSHDPLPRKRTPSAEERQRMRVMQGKNNFGFEKVERLEGNVGYLELHGFMDAEAAGDTAAAAMNFLAHTDALIIDLRQNGGGSPGMVALLCSYLFANERKHLNDLVWRGPEGERVEQWWTVPHVAGRHYANEDVYLLTSKRTFSAAEEFTYNLQALKRATVVGETTGGGAHPGGPRPINDHFVIWVPSGRAVNPITKTNWEGTGVKPDVLVPAELALKTAHLAALHKQLAKGDTDPRLQAQLQGFIEKTQKELEELKKSSLADRASLERKEG
jgi:hypothetical protein